MPRLTTLNSLYKFIPAKLCYPMRIRIQDLTHWCVDDWYGEFRSKHIYNITIYQDRVSIRYENDYWNEEVINKYDSANFS